jgi:hypothetical protein
MFGLTEKPRQVMAQLFQSQDEMNAVIENLDQKDTVFGHYAFLKMASGSYEEVRIDAFYSGGSGSEVIFLILDRHDHAMAEGVINYAHTCIKGRLQVEKRSEATSSLIDDLFIRLKTLERIGKSYWEKPAERTPTRSLLQCLNIAYVEGRFKFNKCNWPNNADYGIPSLDPESMQDIFRNVFSNIDKHAYDEAQARVSGKRVSVVFIPDGSFVLIRVADEGRGFQPDVIAAVNSPRLTGAGGLGLRAIKLTVAASPDGRIAIGNNENKPGAWIEIRLRALPRESED